MLREQGLCDNLLLVAQVHGEILEERPLMALVDQHQGLPRLLTLMEGERVELADALKQVDGLPRERWNGHAALIAGEASDVWVFGAAAWLFYPEQVALNGRFWQLLSEANNASLQAGVDIRGATMGLLKHKVALNYPAWAFQLIEGESFDKALQRDRDSVVGLKRMRQTHENGWLTEAVLDAFGFNQKTHGKDPVLAYSFLRQVANSTIVM